MVYTMELIGNVVTCAVSCKGVLVFAHVKRQGGVSGRRFDFDVQRIAGDSSAFDIEAGTLGGGTDFDGAGEGSLG